MSPGGLIEFDIAGNTSPEEGGEVRASPCGSKPIVVPVL